MEALPFQVEIVDPNGKFVVGRQLGPGLFEVDDETRLHGCRISAAVNRPAQEADGSPRVDLYIFALKNPGDASKFRAGETVMLNARRKPVPKTLY